MEPNTVQGNEDETSTKARNIHARFTVPIILCALYLPQSWVLFIHGPVNGNVFVKIYAVSGLPMFAPMYVIQHFLGAHPFFSTWMPALTLFVAAGLYILSFKRALFFWISLAVATGLSIWSALALHFLLLR